MRTVALLAAAANLVSARRGVDLSVSTDTSVWKCLMTDYNVSYAFVRAYRSVGELDANAPSSIVAASDAGLFDLHAYIFPCVSTSPYSIANGIKCDSAKDQMKATISYLEQNGVHVARKNQPILQDGAPYVRRIWLDIEDESPSKYFDPDVTVNQQLLADLISEGEAEGIFLGMYTTKTYWTNIMGGIEGYSNYPLW